MLQLLDLADCLFAQLIVFFLFIKNFKLNQALVAHACTPSYSGGRDEQDRGSKPATGK
jgi:hypothetical protein